MPLDTFEHDQAGDIIVQSDGCVQQPMAIPVYVDGPVETRELASRYSVLRSFTAPQSKAGGQPVKICGQDPRRRVIRISAYDSTGTCVLVTIGGSANEATGQYAYQLPLLKTAGTPTAAQPVAFTGIGELWVMGDANGPAIVSVSSESWI